AAEVIKLIRPTLVIVDATHADGAAALATPVLTLEALGRRADVEAMADVRVDGFDENDPHVVFFTSGSTGVPKGVVLTHAVSVLRSHPGSQLEPRGRMVCPFPLFHMGAWTIATQQWHARDAVIFT